MIEFWLAIGLLLLAGMAFLLVPALRSRGVQAEEDRTALNVALYQERLAELQSQRAAGTLTEEQFIAGQGEAARELLEDTEGNTPKTARRLGKAIPLVLALLLPCAALGLYLHWGASQTIAQLFEQPSVANMTERLQQEVKNNPDSAEAWYFLGRLQMGNGQAAEAAEAFAQALRIAGREPELLGQLAQAQYFANNKQWSPELQMLTDEALRLNQNEVTSLGLLGIAAFEAQRYTEAVTYWQRLADLMPASDPSRAAIVQGIQQAQARAGVDSEQVVSEGPRLHVEVDLSAEAKAQTKPDDTVFVFARAVSGPPMPLAAKRLTVADLPARVELTDQDAMLAQMNLSSAPEVQLVARISRSGDATEGQWIGIGDAIANSTAQVQQLLIDTAEKTQ